MEKHNRSSNGPKWTVTSLKSEEVYVFKNIAKKY